MVNKKQNEPSIDELIKLAEQISLLIEDNNQNIKDCTEVLKKIQTKICPKKPSLLSLAIQKLLNKN
jgi:hypothetical protein